MVVVRISTRSAFYIHEWCVSFILSLSVFCLLTSSRKYCLVERISEKKNFCRALDYIPWSIVMVTSGLSFTFFVCLHVHVHAWCIYTYLHLWTHHGNLVWLKKLIEINTRGKVHLKGKTQRSFEWCKYPLNTKRIQRDSIFNQFSAYRSNSLLAEVINPFTPKISLLILLTVCHTIL